jgi:adenylate kinase
VEGLQLNQEAMTQLAGETRLEIVPGASHLSPSPGRWNRSLASPPPGSSATSSLVRLALLGKPGAGKGTQGVRLARLLGAPLISTGELLRRRAEGDGPGAADLADLLARGELVPDDLVVSVVNDAVASAAASAAGGYILDGFPRTLAQARHPDTPVLDAVVHVDVPDDVALRRIAERAAGRTDDARRDATERRLQCFRSETEPVLNFYRRRGILTTVDGTQPPEQVTEAILQALPVPEGEV